MLLKRFTWVRIWIDDDDDIIVAFIHRAKLYVKKLGLKSGVKEGNYLWWMIAPWFIYFGSVVKSRSMSTLCIYGDMIGSLIVSKADMLMGNSSCLCLHQSLLIYLISTFWTHIIQHGSNFVLHLSFFFFQIITLIN